MQSSRGAHRIRGSGKTAPTRKSKAQTEKRGSPMGRKK